MRAVLISFALMFSLVQSALAEDAWPNRPIKLIVSAAAGSANDVIGRWYGEKLSRALGQPVIIDNKPGGANLIAMQAAKSAPADGYTLILGTSASFATNPYLMKGLPYDALKDFVPVALVSRPGFMITVNARLPVHNIPELVAYAKTKPEGVTVAVDGPRNFTGLTAAYLSKTIGAPLRLVSYKNIVQGAQDTATGVTDMVIQGYGLVYPLVQRGDLRAIAVTSPGRFALLPDLPAVSETHPGFDITGWLAIFTPAGTPDAVVHRLNAEMDRIIKDPETKAWGDRAFVWVEPQAGTPAELKDFVHAQYRQWGGMVNQLGVKPE
jgi:tripartite-type tricarboxylate transporter receptor subunit TctC